MRSITAILLILLPFAATASGVVRPVHVEPVLQPPHACHKKPQDFTCTVKAKLHVASGGAVDRVDILESSGDRPCDASTRLALAKYRFDKRVGRVNYTTTMDSYSCGASDGS